MVVLCDKLEAAYGLPTATLRFEVQVELPSAVLGADGTATVARLITAAAGRCTGLHYGTYDYSAAAGVAAAYQSMDHPVADHAKAVMQAAAAGTGVRLSDGSTNVLPVGAPTRCTPAWALHARLVRRSLERGFYQGWDLHPAQLPTRYAATYAFFRGRSRRGGDPAAPVPGPAVRRHPRRTGDRPGARRFPAARSGLRRPGRRRRRFPPRRTHRTGLRRSFAGGRGRCRLGSAHGRPGAPVPPHGHAAGRAARRRRRAGGRIVAVEPRTTPCCRPAPTPTSGTLALLPGPGRHPRARQRARAVPSGRASPRATRAAAAGGVTTIVDMPLNSLPPTVHVDALAVKRHAAAGQCHVDVGFWGGAIPGNATDLPGLHAAGVFGFKAFLADSGVPEFPPLDPAGLAEALAAVDALFVVHAEDPRPAARRGRRRRATRTSSRRRPPEAEHAAVAGRDRRGPRGRTPGCTSCTCRPRRRCRCSPPPRRDGVRVSAETCPHYLTLHADDIADGATEFKCCPPIRDAANADALWHARSPTGCIDCVVSDHSPCTPELKRRDTGDFAAAWGGIASRAARPAGDLDRRAGARVTPRRRGALDGAGAPPTWPGSAARAGSRSGADADLVAFDPDGTFVVDPAGCTTATRSPRTPGAT